MLPNTGKAVPGDLHHCFIKTTQPDRATGCTQAGTHTLGRSSQPGKAGSSPVPQGTPPSKTGGPGHKAPAIISSCSSGSLSSTWGIWPHLLPLSGKGDEQKQEDATLVCGAICQCDPRPSQQARAAPNLNMETLESIRPEKPSYVSWRHGSD